MPSLIPSGEARQWGLRAWRERRTLIGPRLRRKAVVLACGLALTTGCSTLPEMSRVIPYSEPAVVRLQDKNGPLSLSQSAAILAKFKRDAGATSILDRHMAVEKAIVDSPLIVGNKVTLLQDGTATYEAMFAAIRRARHHVNLETYIIEDDEVGRQFADLLIEKQNQGMQVNLIYDSVGAINTPQTFFDRLGASGIRLLEFNPVNPLSVKRKWLLNNRDHRKLLIVDGRTAFLGGINISGVYSRGSFSRRSKSSIPQTDGDTDAWRDTHVQVDGPVVAEFQKLFLETWRKQKGEELPGTGFFPVLEERGQDVVHAIGSTADEPHSRIYLTLLSAILSAEKSIYLTNAYFVPDPQLLRALKDAARRGVDVRLILPSKTDFWAVFHAGRSHYSDLLRAGVKIFERRGTVLHSKTALIDGVWSSVGSTNLDWRSFLHNDEINAVVLGPEFAQQMDSMFVDDLLQSDEVKLEQWKRRPITFRIKERFARLWEYWL